MSCSEMQTAYQLSNGEYGEIVLASRNRGDTGDDGETGDNLTGDNLDSNDDNMIVKMIITPILDLAQLIIFIFIQSDLCHQTVIMQCAISS